MRKELDISCFPATALQKAFYPLRPQSLEALWRLKKKQTKKHTENNNKNKQNQTENKHKTKQKKHTNQNKTK